ncbi:MAG: hypothetical protein ACR2I3_17525, partial [Rhodococcus sp. (in: high G+C Gram-positive bacteria)]
AYTVQVAAVEWPTCARCVSVRVRWQIAMTNPWLTVVPVVEERENPWWHPVPVRETPKGLHRTMYGKLGKVVGQFGSWADRQIQISGSPSMIRTTIYALSAAGTPRQNISFDPL